MLQTIIEQCKAKAQIVFNKLQEQAASVAAEAKAVAKNLLAEAQQQAEKVYTLGRRELLLLWEKGRARAAQQAGTPQCPEERTAHSPPNQPGTRLGQTAKDCGRQPQPPYRARACRHAVAAHQRWVCPHL